MLNKIKKYIGILLFVSLLLYSNVVYADEFFTTYSEDRREQIIEELVFDFCSVLENRIASDGQIEVRLISADLETGLFQIGVTEEYTYPFGGMNGKCYYEKAYSFN